MKLIGVDIDGTLIGKKAEAFYEVVEQLRQEIQDGSEVVLVTSRTDVREGQHLVWDQWGINLPAIGTTRDWPMLKGQALRDYRDTHLKNRVTSIELWDDECWYLDHAAQLGIVTRRFYKGSLIEHTCQPGFVPWTPKTPRPQPVLLDRLP